MLFYYMVKRNNKNKNFMQTFIIYVNFSPNFGSFLIKKNALKYNSVPFQIFLSHKKSSTFKNKDFRKQFQHFFF